MIVNIRPRISSPFGSIDKVHTHPHTGVDIALPEGTPLHAVADSIVKRVVHDGASDLGNGVILHTPDGHDVIYGHMSQITVRPGEHLHFGDVIGLSGNTGHSTGPHLHLGVIKEGHYIDPTRLVSAAVSDARPKGHSGPFGGMQDAIESFNETVAGIGQFLKDVAHWLNPATWWNELNHLFSSGMLDSPLMIGTILGIILIMGGAKWPKKWIAWGWAIFWVLRGMVFA